MKLTSKYLEQEGFEGALFWNKRGSFTVIGPTVDGNGVTIRDLRPGTVSQVFSDVHAWDSDYLTSDIVRMGFYKNITWYVQVIPAGRHTITLAYQKQNKVIQVPLPTLIFIVVGAARYVFASKQRSFSPQAVAYHAPLPNLNKTGVVCWGNNPKKTDGWVSRQETWTMFLRSPFTANSITNKSKSYPDDVRKLLLSLDGKQRFPNSELIHMGQMGEVIHQTLKGVLK